MSGQKRTHDDFVQEKMPEFELPSSNPHTNYGQQWPVPYSTQTGGMEHQEWQALLPGLPNEHEFHSSLASSATTTPIPEPWPFFDGHAAFHGGGLPGKARVCFGMLHEIGAKALVSAEVLNKALTSSNRNAAGNYQFEVKRCANNFVIASRDPEPIAILNERVGPALHSICELETVEFRGYASPSTWNSPKSSQKESKKKIYVAVNINIYGDKSIQKQVGTSLSSAQVYLQHPDFLEEGCQYDNPHFVSIPNVQPSLPSPLQDRKKTCTASKLSPEPKSDRNDFQNEIAVVFNSLTRARCLKILEADMRIKTKLLTHQKEALDFMTQREFGPVPQHYSLWRQTKFDIAHGPCFEHIITGSKSQAPQPETGGGILADDMGLGKTLTCIAMITRTAQLATEFWKSGYSVQESLKDSLQTARHAARATLVIVPSQVLVTSWIQEIEKHVYGRLDVCIYHGREREENPEMLAKADIVFTTYHTIASSAEGLKAESPLFRVCWFRIVLDEAHTIRSGSTKKLYQTAARLDSKLRWCLTGTPVQNKLEDLGSLVSFLRIPQLDTAAAFRKHVIQPLMKSSGAGSESLRLLLDSICLRRSRKLLDLPETNVNDRVLEFSEAEREQYLSAELSMSKAIKHQANLESTKERFFGIFQLEMRLRRLCNHGTFQRPFSQSHEGDTRDLGFNTQKPKDNRCDYCKLHLSQNMIVDELFNGHFTVCGHLLCSECLPQFEHAVAISKDESGLRCPLCDTRINGDYLQQGCSNIADELGEDGVSSKVLGLLADLEENAGKGKSIIFSGWTKSLDLIERFLRIHQFRFERIDGSCSITERNRILNDFKKNSNTQILMMTTGTGAVGLNLAVANFVYIMEPQWNPMVESQAIARAVRLGQKKNVSVIRYIMKGTIEETLRSQQVRKLALAGVGWRGATPETAA